MAGKNCVTLVLFFSGFQVSENKHKNDHEYLCLCQSLCVCVLFSYCSQFGLIQVYFEDHNLLVNIFFCGCALWRLISMSLYRCR